MKRRAFQILSVLCLCMSAQAGLNDGLVAYYQLNAMRMTRVEMETMLFLLEVLTNASDRFGDSSMAAFVGLNGKFHCLQRLRCNLVRATFSFWYQPETTSN